MIECPDNTPEIRLESGILLRPMTVDLVSDAYVSWMRDPDVTRFLETRWHEQNKETVLAFVETMHKSKNQFFWGIFLESGACHVGTVKLGPVDIYNAYADVSFLIGLKSARGKGVATQAVRAVCQFGFEQLKLHRVRAGYIYGNNGSAKLFERLGFNVEGYRKEQAAIGKKQWADVVEVGLLARDFTFAKTL